MSSYRILGLPNTASAQEVKRAYRKMALKYHPDKNNSPEARQVFILVTTAYRLLIDKQGNLIARSPGFGQSGERPTGPMTGRQRDDLARQKAAEKRARGEAENLANTSYEEFSKTRIYKTAMVINGAFDYIFLLLGVVMSIAPWVYYLKHKPNTLEELSGELAFGLSDATFAATFGVAFTIGIYQYLFKKQNKPIL